MMFGSDRRAALPVLLLMAVFARALVPLGYMPTAAGSDLWFELCPEGLTPELAQYLAGLREHGHSGHDGHADPDGEAHACPLGHLLAAAAAVDHPAPILLSGVSPLPPIPVDYDFTSRSASFYRSRGPPA
jgi:hypothetical protein